MTITAISSQIQPPAATHRLNAFSGTYLGSDIHELRLNLHTEGAEGGRVQRKGPVCSTTEAPLLPTNLRHL
ncbi:hypothetical protein LshimejAT787_1700040 [Lyophyllum shimeji]|uniref:Uncharacterized protein n=1 Tax=Lyophyllum shimeji TaxID=47721 RepID=A0A9P3PWP7_LYOSH|nr:hypothetical protein LshimejAT787_1700040 [Lyophyllum shimeji]